MKLNKSINIYLTNTKDLSNMMKTVETRQGRKMCNLFSNNFIIIYKSILLYTWCFNTVESKHFFLTNPVLPMNLLANRNTEAINFRCWKMVWFFEQVPFDVHIYVITGPIFTNLHGCCILWSSSIWQALMLSRSQMFWKIEEVEVFRAG